MQYITIQSTNQAACLEDVSAGLVVHLLAAVEHVHHDPDGPGGHYIDWDCDDGDDISITHHDPNGSDHQ